MRARASLPPFWNRFGTPKPQFRKPWGLILAPLGPFWRPGAPHEAPQEALGDQMCFCARFWWVFDPPGGPVGGRFADFFAVFGSKMGGWAGDRFFDAFLRAKITCAQRFYVR